MQSVRQGVLKGSFYLQPRETKSPRRLHLRLLELENLLNLGMTLVPSRELTKTLWGQKETSLAP